MLRIAFATLAARKSGMLGALAAVGLAVVLVVSCGILLESSLRAPISRRAARAPPRSSSRPARPSSGERRGRASRCPSGARARRPRSPTRLRTLPGVARAIADRSFPLRCSVRRGRRSTGRDDAPRSATAGRAPRSHRSALTSGHAPKRLAEVVARRPALRAAGRLELGDALRIDDRRTRGERFASSASLRRRAWRPARGKPRSSSAGTSRARLAGSGDRADLIGVRPRRPAPIPSAVADACRAALAGADLRVLTGARRGEAESPGRCARVERTSLPG